MTSPSAMPGSYYHASAYTMTCIKLPEYYPGNHLSIHHNNSSHRDSSYPLSAAVFSPSLSESSYTGHPVTKGYEIVYNTDVQSKSYCASEAQSRRGGNGMPYNDSTIKGGTQNNYTAEIRQKLAVPGYNSPANVPGHFRPLSAKFATPWYSPYLDASFEECQPTDFSSNGYSSIGSQFELDDSQILEGNLFMDPMFSQNLSSDDHYCPNSIAASQTVFENHLLPLIPSLPTNRPVPPVDLIARTHMSGPCRDVSIPVIHPGRAVLPIESTTRLDPATKYSSAGLTAPWTISPSVAFAETTHLHQPSAFNNPCYNASLRPAGSHTPPHSSAASIDCPWNVTSTDSIAMTEASADPDFKLRCLGQVFSPSLAFGEVLKTNRPQVITYQARGKSLDATPSKKRCANRSVSVTRPELEHGLSKCSYEGCSTIRRGKYHASNMRNHVRDTHEQPVRPVCETCGKKDLKKTESLRRHVEKLHPGFYFPVGVKKLWRTGLDGTPYSTYQQVHDYIKMRKMEKA